MRDEFRASNRTVTVIAACVAAMVLPVSAADWATWRGPGQNGMAYEKAVVTKWSPDGENLLWKSPEGGRTTPLIMNGRMYFIGPVGDGECLQERVICLDAETGKTIWDYHFNVFFSDIVAQRVGWTALAGDEETGNVYAHGTGGEMLCLDRDGKVLWKHSLTEEYNRVSGYGGRLVNPAIDEDRVIVSFLSSNWGNHAKPAHRFVTFDKRTGKVVWWAESMMPPADTVYATPVVTVVDGRRQLICGGGDGVVYGLESRTGRIVWSFKLTKMGCNSSPVADGKYVYISHSEENIDNTTMGRLVCIDASKTGDITKTGEVWRLDGLDAGYASPALANGRLYHVDNGANLHCIDAKTGKAVWKHKLGRVGKGSATVTADGVIYVGEQNGVFWVLKDAGDHAEELSKVTFEGLNHTIDELYGSPTVCGGRVYFMTRYATYCLGSKESKADVVPVPALAAERSAAGQKPTTMTIFPADVSLIPGGTAQFEVRLFGESGAKLDGPTPKVEWSLVGVKGELSPEGLLTASAHPVFSAGMVSAKVGGLSATARARVTQRLPIYETFEQMKEDAPPPGWTGTMGKTKIVKYGDSKVFQKLAEKAKPSPVWKMRAYVGEPVAGGYTVQADLLGTLARRRFRPDMGIINSRYELIMLGQAKELELSRWRDEPTHGLRKKIPFEMKTDAWYRMKLRVKMNLESAQVQAKVWLREEKEPEAWTLEFEDPCPNREGCPGLFAYSNGTTDKSNGAEVYYDNVKVSVNE
ncbi:MAG TPA: PQQ-binding-like beta-propeller repeat protein [Phycisphaerae bacterium]|nr:PQQ-binding-like beta-propeller repeat protein [Phycisphaerae bacterium]